MKRQLPAIQIKLKNDREFRKLLSPIYGSVIWVADDVGIEARELFQKARKVLAGKGVQTLESYSGSTWQLWVHDGSLRIAKVGDKGLEREGRLDILNFFSHEIEDRRIAIQEIGKIIVNTSVISSVDVFYYVGFGFNRLLTLLGLYVIYKLPLPGRVSGELFLNMYLIILVAILSHSFDYIYNLTALILLVFIINKYVKVYKKDKLVNTKILLSAFILLAVSQIIFIFSRLNSVYVTAQSLQLVSYIILLALIIKILKNGKKKKQGRDNA